MPPHIATVKKEVEQLKKEVKLDRMKVSEASNDLMKYCQENNEDDVLLNGVPSSRNPFVERRLCNIL